jgi:hypothetical protein
MSPSTATRSANRATRRPGSIGPMRNAAGSEWN